MIEYDDGEVKGSIPLVMPSHAMTDSTESYEKRIRKFEDDASEQVSEELDPTVNVPWMRCSPDLPEYIDDLERRLRAAQYPHMCRDDHEQIGYSGGDELCPVCRANNAINAERAKIKELEGQLAEAKSWSGLMATFDEFYPSNIFDGSSGDAGPRLIVAIRELAAEREARKEAEGKWRAGIDFASALERRLRATEERYKSLEVELYQKPTAEEYKELEERLASEIKEREFLDDRIADECDQHQKTHDLLEAERAARKEK